MTWYSVTLGVKIKECSPFYIWPILKCVFFLSQHHKNDVIDLWDQFPDRFSSVRTFKDRWETDLLWIELKNRSMPGRHHMSGVSEEGAASSAEIGRCPWSLSSNPEEKTIQSGRRKRLPAGKKKKAFLDGSRLRSPGTAARSFSDAAHWCRKTFRK